MDEESRVRCKRIPIAEMRPDDALRRWPRLCAHVICHSLGYATPTRAADIVLAAARRRPHFCEWIDACYAGDPLPAVQAAIQGRHTHRGYMAEYRVARALVEQAIHDGDHCVFASWF